MTAAYPTPRPRAAVVAAAGTLVAVVAGGTGALASPRVTAGTAALALCLAVGALSVEAAHARTVAALALAAAAAVALSGPLAVPALATAGGLAALTACCVLAVCIERGPEDADEHAEPRR